MKASSQIGNDNLLTLEDVWRSWIKARTTLIWLQRDRVRYSIALCKVMGGGWQATD